MSAVNHVAFIAGDTIWSYRRLAVEIERTALVPALTGGARAEFLAADRNKPLIGDIWLFAKLLAPMEQLTRVDPSPLCHLERCRVRFQGYGDLSTGDIALLASWASSQLRNCAMSARFFCPTR